MSVAIKKANEIFVNQVPFKRASKTLLAYLKSQNPAYDYSRHQIDEILSVAMGYANYHDLTADAKRNVEKLDSSASVPDRMAQFLEESLERDRAWFEAVCPESLLKQCSLSWLNTAMHLTRTNSFLHRMKPKDQPNVTVIVGKYSNLVLQAWSKVNSASQLFELGSTHNLKQIHKELSSFLPPKLGVQPNGESYIRSVGHYYCIGGLTSQSPLSPAMASALVDITSIDHGSDFALSVSRADLLKLTSPDFDKPHFHFIRIIDLDLIDENPLTATREFWTKEEYRSHFLWPDHLKS